MQTYNKYRFIFGAGGTGGHLFPALAVAEKIKTLKPEAEILFLGRKDKIEGKVIPGTEFVFKPVIIAGIQRGKIFGNLLFPLKLLAGAMQSLAIAMKFKPRVALGAGAYVAAPVLWAADLMGAKIVLLEQNSYPGITNRFFDKKAKVIFAAFEEAKKYFRFPEKVRVVGNPVRINMRLENKTDARKKLGLDAEKKVLLVLGGSLGAKSINEAVAEMLPVLKKENISILWQTGGSYYDKYKDYNGDDVKVVDFIEDVASYYSAADLIIARAGATTIAEIAYLGLPAILIPSPNVAANHQFKNAEELAKTGAAEIVADNEIREKLLPKIKELIYDKDKLNGLALNVKKFAKKDAAEIIALEAIKLAEKN